MAINCGNIAKAKDTYLILTSVLLPRMKCLYYSSVVLDKFDCSNFWMLKSCVLLKFIILVWGCSLGCSLSAKISRHNWQGPQVWPHHKENDLTKDGDSLEAF